MEEKKLTDEEIVKALECCAVGRKCGECPYCIKKIDCLLGQRAEVDWLDLIHRLQDENERLTKEKDKYKGLYEIMYRKYSDLQHKEFNFDALRKQRDEYLDKALELQKQVDELKIKTCPNADYCGGRIQQAVKDTAKEIFDEINSCIEKGQEYCGLDWRGLLTAKYVVLAYCKKKGVEV